MQWHALEAAKTGLFCQTITIPLFKEHRILVQVAGDGSRTIKLQPSLIITDGDCTWIETAFEAAIAAAHKPGAVLALGKSLVEHAVRANAE
jgi:ornithine--oxo-acid transaminase